MPIANAEFVINVVKTIGADRKQERVLARANAIVNQVFVLSVNAAGPVAMGGSLMVDPEGTVIADLPTAEPGVIRVVLDLDDVTRVRERGTEGYNRMWSQMAPDDPVIDLPVYQAASIPPVGSRWPRNARATSDRKEPDDHRTPRTPRHPAEHAASPRSQCCSPR